MKWEKVRIFPNLHFFFSGMGHWPYYSVGDNKIMSLVLFCHSVAGLVAAVSSSPRPWIDVFALLEKNNIAVTDSEPDPKVRKMSIFFLMAVRPLSWACVHGTEMLLILKNIFLPWLFSDIFRNDSPKKCLTILYADNLWLKPVSATGARLVDLVIGILFLDESNHHHLAWRIKASHLLPTTNSSVWFYCPMPLNCHLTALTQLRVAKYVEPTLF